MAVRKQRLPEPEELFLDYVKRMAHHRDGREIVLVHMSELEMMNRTRHHVELVASRLGQMARKFDGSVFRFVNGDIACIMHNASAGHIDNVLFEVRYGFSDDALVQAEDEGHGVFIERFDVRWDYDAVEKLARERYAVYSDALAVSMQTARDEQNFSLQAASMSPQTKQQITPGSEQGKGSAAKSPGKLASLLSLDKGDTKRKHPAALSAGPPRRGPLQVWLQENHIIAGGEVLPLADVVTSVPVFELGATGHPAVTATVHISQADLAAAYTRSVGMKMNDRLESFLVQEAEVSLVSLLGSLVTPVDTEDGAGGAEVVGTKRDARPFERSVCLAPQVILSSTFLLAARDWDRAREQQGEKGTLFWFSPEAFDPAAEPMAYIVDFLHDMGHFAGVRGLIPGEVGTLAARLPRIDGWSLTWPDMDLRRVPQGDIDGLSRALERWGPGHTFLQGINTEDKARAAESFGFRYAECTDIASRKLFTR